MDAKISTYIFNNYNAYKSLICIKTLFRLVTTIEFEILNIEHYTF